MKAPKYKEMEGRNSTCGGWMGVLRHEMPI